MPPEAVLTPPAAPSATPPAAPPATPPVTPPAASVPPVPPPAAPAAGDPPAPPAVPPAEPVYALTLPAESVLDASAVERMTALAKGQKIAPDAAQKSIEFADAEVKSFVEKQKTDYTAKVNGWEATIKADPELGGANLTRTTKRGVAVLERFGDQELTEALKASGFGNYPALVRFFNRIGAAIESDGPGIQGTSAPVDQRSTAEILYPTKAST